MIISYSKKFVFIHIPKCGGTTIRELLKTIDEKYLNAKINNLKQRQVDVDHLPIFALKKLLPDVFNIVDEFDSYTIIRSPFDRFISSVSQRLKMFKGKQLKDLDYNQIIKEIKEIIEYLSCHDKAEELLENDFIHFQRQIDYIFYKDRQVIKNIYTIEQAEVLYEMLEKKFELNNLNSVSKRKKLNQTLVYRNHFVKIIQNISKKTRAHNLLRLMPDPIKSYLNSLVYKDSSDLKRKLLREPFINDFITSYYSKDIDFYNKKQNDLLIKKVLK